MLYWNFGRCSAVFTMWPSSNAVSRASSLALCERRWPARWSLFCLCDQGDGRMRVALAASAVVEHHDLLSLPPPLIGGGDPARYSRWLRAKIVTGRRGSLAPDSVLLLQRSDNLQFRAEQNPALRTLSDSARFSFAATTKIAPSHLPRTTGEAKKRQGRQVCLRSAA